MVGYGRSSHRGAPLSSIGLSSQEIQRLLDEAHSLFADETTGECSSLYPVLEATNPDLFGICFADTLGGVYSTGDSTELFAIMSAVKPFTLAIACQAVGPDLIRTKVGSNATGLPFNSLDAIELNAGGLTNPMVNAGAMITISIIPGKTKEERWSNILDGLCGFAGRPLSLDAEVYRSSSETNLHNREIARALDQKGALECDASQIVDLYTRQSAVSVTARDLATMAATLSNRGVNPTTGERVVDSSVCRYVLTAMATAGMYETSGEWLYRTGHPAKSAVSGAMCSVSPGKGGLGVYSPRVDEVGNSVRGQLVTAYLAPRLDLDMFT